jgi:3',5'-nucleoside bisphosphate phosphatase
VSGFDLHTHTTFSDGTTSPEDNVRLAVGLGLDGLGVTDHDTTAGFERSLVAAEGTGLELVLGTEFSAELGGLSVHVLGFWIDPGYGPLAEELDRLRNERDHRARRIVERFATLGIDISYERVVELAAGAPIGRPHIAQAVVETGACATSREVFDDYLADGGPAYVEKHAVDPARAVQLLVAACGVAVLAHPGLYGDRTGSGGIPDEIVEELAGVGLAGLEADHPDHTADQQRHYQDLARGLGLEVTGGSDYHGDGKDNQLGARTTPREVVERLRGWSFA